MIRIVALASLLVAAAFAQSQTSWGRVQDLSGGEEIRVYTLNGRQDGVFVSATLSTLRFRPDRGQDAAVARTDVVRVDARSRSHRTRNVLVGAAIGVGIGIAMYGTYGQLLRNEGAEDTYRILLVPSAAGATIGAILPSGGYKKIYQAEEPDVILRP